MGEVSDAQPIRSPLLTISSSHPLLLHLKDAQAHLIAFPGKLSIVVPPAQDIPIDVDASSIKGIDHFSFEVGKLSFVLKIVTPTPIPQEGQLKIMVANVDEYNILIRLLEYAGGAAKQVAVIALEKYHDARATGGTVHVSPQNPITLNHLKLMQLCGESSMQLQQAQQKQQIQMIPHRRPPQNGRVNGELRSAKDEIGRKRTENGVAISDGTKKKKATHVVQRTVIESDVPPRSAISTSAGATPAYLLCASTPDYLAVAEAAGVPRPPSSNALINAMAASAAAAAAAATPSATVDEAAAAAQPAADAAASAAATPAAPTAAPTDGEIAPSSSMPVLSNSMPTLSNSMPVLTSNPAEPSGSAAVISSLFAASPQPSHQPQQQSQLQPAAGSFLNWLPPSVGFGAAPTPGYCSVTGGVGGWQSVQQQQLLQPSLLQMMQYHQQPMQQPAMANFLMNAMHSAPAGMAQSVGAQNMAMAMGALPGMQYMAPTPFAQLQQLQLPQPQPQQGARNNNLEEYRVNSREFEELASKVHSLGAIRGRYLMDVLKNIAHLSG